MLTTATLNTTTSLAPLASPPTSSKAFGTPGFIEKSSISLLSTKPVPGTTTALP